MCGVIARRRGSFLSAFRLLTEPVPEEKKRLTGRADVGVDGSCCGSGRSCC